MAETLMPIIHDAKSIFDKLSPRQLLCLSSASECSKIVNATETICSSASHCRLFFTIFLSTETFDEATNISHTKLYNRTWNENGYIV